MVFGTSPEINQCKTLGYALSINASIYKGFKIGSAQVWYQVLAISGGEQFDRSKPLLRQAEKRVGFKAQSDIQDIETSTGTVLLASTMLFNGQSDIQDIETALRLPTMTFPRQKVQRTVRYSGHRNFETNEGLLLVNGRSKRSPIFRT